MLSEKDNKRLSKLLSYVLRHHPEWAGIVLDEQGWADTSALVKNIAEKEPLFSLEVLQHIVETNSKKRFSFNDDGSQILASQGHSIAVELALTPQQPPEILFHGTAEKNLLLIQEKGLLKMERHHVHLTENRETAKETGARYGNPVVLAIRAGEMFWLGFEFYITENNVWLTETVPPAFCNW